MIARGSKGSAQPEDVWTKLSAPLPDDVIQWRQDGRPTQRDGKFYARFVAYIDANFVRERLDDCVPGDWDLTLELLPTPTPDDDDGAVFAFKARLQILGVIREDIGQGRDYKAAATDAMKRAARQFGIGSELAEIGQNWVQVDGDNKYARPVEDPAAAYARRHKPNPTTSASRDGGTARGKAAHSPTATSTEPPARSTGSLGKPGKVQDALTPNEPWANDPDVALTDDGLWIIKGVALDEMSKSDINMVRLVAQKRGYDALANDCIALLDRKAGL
jgi:hypothetical protein